MPHLVETYALNCGVKIGKPQILEKFFPLTVEKYITLHPQSKYESKNYSFWQDVINLLLPILNKEGISIVQIGQKDDRKFAGCYLTSGQTNIGQVANIVSNAILHLGADSFATHIASSYGKKIVCLYSNNHISAVRPYWTNSDDCILLEPLRAPGVKPNFVAQENPKSINTIRPEDIAEAVCKLLNLSFTFDKETIFVGQFYGNALLEMVPDQIVNPATFGIDALSIRLDYLFNEDALIEQLKSYNASLITDKPISKDILSKFKGRIREIIYEITEEHKPEFVKVIAEQHIPYHLTSKLSEDIINNIKLDYLDFVPIHIRGRIDETSVKNIKNVNRPLFYKSSKALLSDGKTYPSEAAWRAKAEVSNMDETCPVIDTPEFWRELDFMRILSTKK